MLYVWTLPLPAKDYVATGVVTNLVKSLVSKTQPYLLGHELESDIRGPGF